MKGHYMVNLFLWIVILLYSINGTAQNKLERELGIEKDQVPQQALKFINESCGDIDIDWYLERNLKGSSYEAKFKKFELWHSVEFDTLGRVEDVEILRSYREIPSGVREEIEDELEDAFKKYKIEKIQLQLKGEPSQLMDYLNRGEIRELDLEIAYEVVILGIVDREVKRFELLFDATGELERKVEVITRETDNLAY